MQKALPILVALFGLSGVARADRVETATNGFQCDAYVGAVIDDPAAAVRVFVRDDTNQTIALPDARHQVTYEGYGDGLRVTIATVGAAAALAISAVQGTSVSVLARDGATSVTATCQRGFSALPSR